MEIEHSVSAGAIVYRKMGDEVQYLVMKSRAHDWEFPKGGVEGDEELQQTVLRELEEETGIEDIKLEDGYRESYDYEFYANNKKIKKTVHLFIARVFNPDVKLSKEHHDYQWRSYEEAVNTLTHSSVKQLLEEAHEYIVSELVEMPKTEDKNIV
jgi:8-oxo-dGTP pyrophosphatase MutT (NUDIX family)